MMDPAKHKKFLPFGVLLLSLLSFGLASQTPEFPRTCIKIGSRTIEVKVAKALKELEGGLSGISALGMDEGMLFVFSKKAKPVFHMRGVCIPLSVAFIDGKGTILKIEDMDPKNPSKIYPSPEETRYALEMNKGWFGKNGIKPGDKISSNRKKLKAQEHCPVTSSEGL